jgi:hypothetical protein
MGVISLRAGFRCLIEHLASRANHASIPDVITMLLCATWCLGVWAEIRASFPKCCGVLTNGVSLVSYPLAFHLCLSGGSGLAFKTASLSTDGPRRSEVMKYPRQRQSLKPLCTNSTEGNRYSQTRGLLSDPGFVYAGIWGQLANPSYGTLLRRDSIFIRRGWKPAAGNATP